MNRGLYLATSLFGDIFDNFLVSNLDNTNNVPQGLEDDVSMALGWDFALNAGETATIQFNIQNTAAPTGFFLSQTDPDSNETIWFSSTLDISSVPEPSTIALLGLGLVGVGLSRRRKV